MPAYETKADEMQRREKALQDTMRYYAATHAEDPRDGTLFDNEVLDALMEVKVKYCTPQNKGV